MSCISREFIPNSDDIIDTVKAILKINSLSKKIINDIKYQSTLDKPDLGIIIKEIFSNYKLNKETKKNISMTLYQKFGVKYKPPFDRYIKMAFEYFINNNINVNNYEHILKRIRDSDSEIHKNKKSLNGKSTDLLKDISDTELKLGIYTRAATYNCYNVIISLHKELNKIKNYDAKKINPWHCVFWTPSIADGKLESILLTINAIKNGPYMSLLAKNSKGETGLHSLLKNKSIDDENKKIIYNKTTKLTNYESNKIFTNVINKITKKKDVDLLMQCAWVYINCPKNTINNIAKTIIECIPPNKMEKSNVIENIIETIKDSLYYDYLAIDDINGLKAYFNENKERKNMYAAEYIKDIFEILSNYYIEDKYNDDFEKNKIHDKKICCAIGIGSLYKYIPTEVIKYIDNKLSNEDSLSIKQGLYALYQTNVFNETLKHTVMKHYDNIKDIKFKFAIKNWIERHIKEKFSFNNDKYKKESFNIKIHKYIENSIRSCRKVINDKMIDDAVDDLKYSFNKYMKEGIYYLDYVECILSAYSELYNGKDSSKYSMKILPIVLNQLYEKEEIITAFQKINKDIINDIKCECPKIYDVIDIFNGYMEYECIKTKIKYEYYSYYDKKSNSMLMQNIFTGELYRLEYIDGFYVPAGNRELY